MPKYKKEGQFWKQVQPPGRPKKFESAYELWCKAVEYFEWMDANPLYKSEWKEGRLREIPVRRPYSMTGLQLWLGVGHDYFAGYKRMDSDHTSAESEESQQVNHDIRAVIIQLEKIIYDQKFEGAASGFFNANIISRDLGLADKRQVEANVNLSDVPIEFE